MTDRDVPFERQVRAALARLHDLPYLQTHPLAGLRGKALQAALTDAVEALRSGTDGTGGRTQRLLALRYVEALDSKDVAARLGISMGEYYREHATALAAAASLLGERLTPSAPTAGPDPAAPGPAVARAGSLPRRIDAFVGREREVGEVQRLFAAAPLVTLVGPGGVGKTRLALEVADGLSEPDEAWFVELAPLADGALVAPAVAAIVGAPAAGDPARALVRCLGARSVLLVLDNCEHLVGACAALAATLLGACPGLRVLATSREPLGVPGEQVWPLPPLRPDEAARLFVARARLVKPGFAVSAAIASAVASICAQLDGIPLAIELAAARARVLAPEEIAARLGDRFRLLVGGSRTGPPRHQTLRAAVEWSHSLLGEAERVLYRRLSVFVGGWGLDAAATVTAAEVDPLDTLASLVDKSLVEADHGADGTRYRMLETLRAHGREVLAAAGETEATGDRHLAWFLGLAERLEPGLWSDREQEGVRALEAEHDNLRAALAWGLERDAEAALRLAAALGRFWRLRQAGREGRYWLATTLERAPSDAAARAPALVAAATLAREAADLDVARRLAEDALVLARARGDRRSAALALNVLAALRGPVTRPDEVERLAHEALDHSRAADFGSGAAAALCHLGLAALGRGNPTGARAWFEEALAEGRRIGSVQTVMAVLGYLGTVSFEEGDLDGAWALLDGARRGIHEAGFGQGGGMSSRTPTVWVQLALARGDLATARIGLHRLLAESRRAGGPLAPISLHWLGVLALRGGDPLRAVRLMAAAGGTITQLRERFTPAEQARYAASLEEARAALSADAFAEAWAAGEAMTVEQAVALGLEDTP